MNKIPTVIFGGSFDPIHNGHIALASEVCRRGIASEVWFLVSPQNPHKVACNLTPENTRLKMVELAVGDNHKFKACDFEISLPRPSYTVNTLEALCKAFPEREFILLIGADNWAVFRKWYKWEDILSHYRIVVYPRGGENRPPLSDGVCWLDAPLCDISSTRVRSIVASGGDASSHLPLAVWNFIEENGMYKKTC